MAILPNNFNIKKQIKLNYEENFIFNGVSIHTRNEC